ncbi:energy-coupling factor transporter transmembrane protein EcfT [Microbacterium aerolatum]|uniref:energy-coupling factor transporter transmembrane component T family protein n=1 Tax=Microbacterium aerolatum TaxID=153731 RepID=UPI00384CBB74
MRDAARDSWLGARNPTVKMALLIAVSVAVLFLFEPAPLLGLYLTGLVGVRLAAGIPWRMLLPAQLPFVVFAGGVLVVNALSRPGEQAFDAPLRITVEGLVVGAALALRALIIGLGTVALTASTTPRAMMISAVQHARIPPRYAYALLAGQRALEAMPRTWATIRAAQAVRAPLGRDGMPKTGLTAFGRAAFALLVDAVRSAERIALALESRGLGDRPRTLWRPVPIGIADAMLAVVVASVFVLVVVSWMLLR